MQNLLKTPKKVSNLAIPLEHAFKELLTPGDKVIDVGCLGWRLGDICREKKLILAGADIELPDNLSKETELFQMHLNGKIDAPDNQFQLTVASHVLEHMQDSYTFMHSLMRITAPGGLVWIESPSELSIPMFETSHVEEHAFESFFTDPTHIKPIPPGAMYRLALACALIPVDIGRCEVQFGNTAFPCTRMLARKPFISPEASQLGPRYVSFREVGPGLETAWKTIWGQSLPA